MKYYLLLSLLITSSLCAQSAEIIYKRSAEYKFTEFSHIEKGKAPAGSQHAITRTEFLNRFDKKGLTSKQGFNYDTKLSLTPYLTGFFSPYSSHGDTYPLRLVYMHDQSINLFNFTFSMSQDDYLFTKFVYGLSPSPGSIVNGWGAHHPATGDYYSGADSPDEGYISFAKEHISLTFGRFKGGIGHGIQGNTFQNSRAPYYDQLQLNLYTRALKFYYMLGGSNHQLTNDELQIQNGDTPFRDYNKTWGGWSNTQEKTTRMSDNIKLFVYHRVEIHPVDIATIGFGEMNLIGGKSPDLNQINPFGLYHDTYDPDYHSYTFSLDLTVVPASRHMLFTEVLLNEIRAPGESNDDPTAIGYQFGYWYIIPSPSGYKQRIALEATHIDTWTYSDSVPYLTMYQRQSRNEFYFDVPLGYSYGGDCEQFSIIYTIVSDKNEQVEIKLSRLSKGEINFSLDEEMQMPYINSKDWDMRPSGTPEHWNTLSLNAEHRIVHDLLLTVLVDYSYIQNFHHNANRDNHLLYFSSGITWEF